MMLSACATKLTADDQVKLINAFANAGCKGAISAAAQGGTGQVGGGFTASASVGGTCDPANRPVVPLPVNPPVTQ